MKLKKPNCRECVYMKFNLHTDEYYCIHPDVDGEPIKFSYPQQRRPEWCPIDKQKKLSKGKIKLV